MIKLNGVEIKPTIFPDKTSQVWKLSEELLNSHTSLIVWEFENESEFMHVAQLVHLLKNQFTMHNKDIRLMIPYLPYGRQDKKVENNATFALYTFRTLLSSLKIDHIESIDIHNPEVTQYGIKNVMPSLDLVFSDFKPTLVCFPDQGAASRGYSIDVPSFSLKKIREQSTGHITSMTCELPLDLFNQRVLIVDDICDGGATFIIAAKYLYSRHAEDVGLYTTHGIYSKGVQVLKDAGITSIYNRLGKVDIK